MSNEWTSAEHITESHFPEIPPVIVLNYIMIAKPNKNAAVCSMPNDYSEL